MREYKHINDCWAALEEAKFPEDIAYITDTFPRWSGDWDFFEAEDGVHVINSYYDKDADEVVEDERVFEDIMTDEAYWDGLV